MNDQKDVGLDDNEFKLGLREEKAIRIYMLKLFAVPTIFLSVMGFLVGYFIKDVAIERAELRVEQISLSAQEKLQTIFNDVYDNVQRINSQVYRDLGDLNRELRETEIQARLAKEKTSVLIQESNKIKATLNALTLYTETEKFVDEITSDAEFVSSIAKQIQKSQANPVISNGDSSCVVIEGVQICWGSKLLTSGTHTRNFVFTFAKQFKSTPIVSNGINAKGSGYLYSVFNHSISKSGYAGDIAENHSHRASDTPVTFNFIAIGESS